MIEQNGERERIFTERGITIENRPEAVYQATLQPDVKAGKRRREGPWNEFHVYDCVVATRLCAALQRREAAARL